MSNPDFVVEKICRQVENAFYSKKPLIVLDTDETELATRVAARCGVVNMKLKSAVNNIRSKFYYEQYVRAEEADLTAYENFSTSPSAIIDLINNGRSCETGAAPTEPKLILIHITPVVANYYSADPEFINILTEYVHSYIGYDDYSPIRSSCVILYGDLALLPKHLHNYIENIVPDYPSITEIRETISDIITKYDSIHHLPQKYIPADADMDSLAWELHGFTLIQAEFFIRKMLLLKQENGAPILCNLDECRAQVLEAKIQNLMRFGGLLELYTEKRNSKKDGDKIGGMKNFVKIIERIKISLGPDHIANWGSSPYKGAIITGVPGTGKSEAGRLLARYLGVPMLKLDMGKLMGSLVGQSERQLREALRQCEEMSPAVVLIEEVEKALSGAKGSNNSTSDTSQRMFGYLLDWLQKDKKAPCFVFATANDIGKIPNEFVRNGRFNIRYASFMPLQDEIENIFAEHMKRAERHRADEAEKKGIKKPGLLFDDNCFKNKNRNSENPAVADGIIDLFLMENGKEKDLDKIKFVSGADIAEIVSRALDVFEYSSSRDVFTEEELRKPITLSAWKKALEITINDDMLQTQGSSTAGLNAIAACYIRLLRKGFVPVSDKAIFLASDYKAERDKNGVLQSAGCSYDREPFIKSEYDRKLYETLSDKIKRLAFTIEEEEHRKETGA